MNDREISGIYSIDENSCILKKDPHVFPIRERYGLLLASTNTDRMLTL